ncbi:MAG: DUF6883 domain-containing protein [Tepidisphaeraceae bacterium]|jgi:hypothetical protein
MKLPNGDLAIVDVRKLRNYCLSPAHRYGRHKARLFANALGLTMAKTDLLFSALLVAARERDAIATRNNGFGQIYEIEFDMTGPRGSATILSVWIILGGEEIPRLVTCYPV